MILKLTFFLVRNGNFGTNFTGKFWFTVLALIVCIYYFIKTRRKEYLVVFFLGSLIWFGIEILLETVGYRKMVAAEVFGIPIPMVIGALLRGTSEAGFVAVAGLVMGDSIIGKKNYFLGLSLGLFLWIYTFIFEYINADPVRDIGGDVDSRRDVFGPIAVIYLGLCIIIDIIWLIRTSPKSRKRGLMMLLMMIGMTAIWTIIEYTLMARWIEISVDGAPIEQASNLAQFLVLAYDVIVEIGFAYLPYYAILDLFGKIQTE